MTSELQRISQNDFQISGSFQNTLLHYKDKAYHVGKLESLHIYEDGSAFLRSLFYQFTIPAQKVKQFVQEFFQTRGTCHQAVLSLPAKLEGVSYKSNKWTYNFKTPPPDTLDFPDLSNLSLEAQIEKVQNLIKIMDYQIQRDTYLGIAMSLHKDMAARILSSLLDDTLTVTSKREEALEPYDPLGSWTYTFDDEGLTYQNLLSHIADEMQKDSSFEISSSFIDALRELSEQFPIQEPKKLGDLIRQMDNKNGLLEFLKTHLNYRDNHLSTLDLMADQVDETLQTISDHQRILLQGHQEEEVKSF